MTAANDPVLDADLDAYVDGALPPQRRIEVEDYLSRHPDLAARVMIDLRVRDELRLAFLSAAPPAKTEARTASLRLERVLARPGRMRLGLRIAASLVLIAAGWTLNESLDAGLDRPVTGANSAAQPKPISLSIGRPLAHAEGGPETYALDRDSDGNPDGIAIDENADGRIDRYRLSTRELSPESLQRAARRLEMAKAFDIDGDGVADFAVDDDKGGTIDWFEVARPPG